jgi:hypothetical protein
MTYDYYPSGGLNLSKNLCLLYYHRSLDLVISPTLKWRDVKICFIEFDGKVQIII